MKKILFQLHHLSTAVNLHGAFKGDIIFHLSFLKARAWSALTRFYFFDSQIVLFFFNHFNHNNKKPCIVALTLVKPPLKQYLLKHTNLNSWMPICYQNEWTRCLNTLGDRTYLAMHFHWVVVLNISGFSPNIL